MKNVEITGKRHCRVVDAPDPVVKGRFALIKIFSAPMCTEVQAYRNGDVSKSLGHEAAGEVVAVGPECRAAIGDRVVVMPQNACGACALCRAGDHIHCRTPLDPLKLCGSLTGRATYAQYCIQQDWLLVPIPKGMGYDHAVMACCSLGPTFTSMRLMNVSKEDTVLVSGLGPVGLGAVINATHRGARVIGMERHPYRVELAKKLGAEQVLDPADPEDKAKVLALTHGQGPDKAVETASVPASPEFLSEVLRPKGQMALVGWSGVVSVPTVVGKGLTVHGAWHWNHLRQTQAMFEVIQRNQAKLDMQVTHHFPLDQVQEAWELQLTGNCGKVMLHPWGVPVQ